MDRLTGWPYDEDDARQQQEEDALRRYLEARDGAVEAALVLLNKAALDSPRFPLEAITAALRTVVDEFNRAAHSDIRLETICRSI